ncbi:UNVERIFIED_CONTAM: hypothetical protein [Bacteriophage sp.]
MGKHGTRIALIRMCSLCRNGLPLADCVCC